MFSLGQQRKQNDPKEEDSSLMSSRMALNDHKAGMQNLDREKINQIIYEASKGSKFFENEKKKDEQVNQRIVEQQKKIATITEYELAAAEKQADIILQNLEQMRNLKRTIVHIDMDAFYAAVETRDNPSLQNKPMAVGSNSMLSTSNYVARRFGVRAAMPGFIAKKLCPQLVIIPPDFKKYTSVSRERPLPGYKSVTFGVSAEDAVQEMRYRIEQRTRLTASAGIAPNTLIAKICSDQNKPNGQFSVPYSREAIEEFMRDLPIRKVCGIGKVTEKMLRALDIITCSHLYKQRGLLHILYSESSFEHFMRVFLGIGSTRVER
ncbi:POLK [Acanthosepion pharaonis]|uniref:DNA polymerase kappa n=1 Tax=Acanthosepion pharaonis TaxID=158019 RepID=A0A812BTN6_ACAPH|nr:POLK [Sepia pharaonis]